MATPTLDPSLQSALISAQQALAAAEAAEKQTVALTVRLAKEYAEIEAQDARIEKTLTDEVTKIVQQMDEDSLEFLGATASGAPPS